MATSGVTILEPATGAGAYVLDVLETVAETVRTTEGEGAVLERLKETAARLVGIEQLTGRWLLRR